MAAPSLWRGASAGPVVAIVTVVAALLATGAAGLPLRDPDNVAALYLLLVGCGVVVLVAIDVALRARRRGEVFPSLAEMRRVGRERWTARRALAVAGALVSFYVSYMAYRNLKSVVPLLEPGTLFDDRLAGLDRVLFAGHDPAALLHTALGTGIQTHLLSAVYAAFIVLLPLSLGVALVFLRDLRAALFFANALSINWLLGAGSYFLLPSLGPVYATPAAFGDLPPSEVTRLQGILLDQRVSFLQDPAAGTPQSIAAFASLHISMSLTATVAAQLLGVPRRLRRALWIWVALTTISTVYFGWHYFVDDLAGVIIAAMALVLARGLGGFDPWSREPPPTRAPALDRAPALT